MAKVKPTTVVAEGYIKDTDHYPATDKNKWNQTKNGSVYVQLGENASWKGVRVKDPQTLIMAHGFLCERRERRMDGYQQDIPVAFIASEVRVWHYAVNAPRLSLKDRCIAFIRRIICTSLSEKR